MSGEALTRGVRNRLFGLSVHRRFDVKPEFLRVTRAFRRVIMTIVLIEIQQIENKREFDWQRTIAGGGRRGAFSGR